MSKLIELNTMAIRQDKLLALMMIDSGEYPSIRFFLSGSENVISIPFTDIPTRDIYYNRIVKQLKNE